MYCLIVLLEQAGPGNNPSSAQIELRLIKSMNDLVNPQMDYKANIVKF